MANPAVFWSLNSILVGILGATVEGTSVQLLTTHAVNIWSFLLAKLGYCVALAAADIIKSRAPLDQENSVNFLRFIAFVSGSLSSVSLVSTFVERSTGYIILYVAWICAAIIIAAYGYGRLFLDGCGWLCYEILKPFLNNIWSRFKSNNPLTETEQPWPPV